MSPCLLPGVTGDPMDARSDVGILKEIYEAERQADRIVRDAEAGARALIADAEAASGADLETRREKLACRTAEALNAQTIEIEKEISEFLCDREAETERWVRARRAGIDRIVDRLVAVVLPP